MKGGGALRKASMERCSAARSLLFIHGGERPKGDGMGRLRDRKFGGGNIMDGTGPLLNRLRPFNWKGDPTGPNREARELGGGRIPRIGIMIGLKTEMRINKKGNVSQQHANLFLCCFK